MFMLFNGHEDMFLMGTRFSRFLFNRKLSTTSSKFAEEKDSDMKDSTRCRYSTAKAQDNRCWFSNEQVQELSCKEKKMEDSENVKVWTKKMTSILENSSKIETYHSSARVRCKSEERNIFETKGQDEEDSRRGERNFGKSKRTFHKNLQKVLHIFNARQRAKVHEKCGIGSGLSDLARPRYKNIWTTPTDNSQEADLSE